MLTGLGGILSQGQDTPSVVAGSLMYLESRNASSYSGSGTTWFDLSGNTNDATLVNGVGYDVVNKDMVFDGTNDYATTALSMTSSLYSSYTVTVRVTFNVINISAGSNRTIIGNVQGSNNPFNFRIEPTTGKILVQFGGGSGSSSLLSTTVVADDTYRTVTFRKSGDDFDLFVDGISEISTNINIGTYTVTNAVQIGRFPGFNSGYYQGDLSTVLIYGTALSDTDILNNHNVII